MPDFATWSVALAGSVVEASPTAFDDLDDSCGSAGSHARLLQLEQDRRWAPSYVIVTEFGHLIAVIPLYLCRAASWPDDAYSPDSHGVMVSGGPEGCLLVGGRSDLRSGLHLSQTTRSPAAFAYVGQILADIGRSQGRDLVFPYVREDVFVQLAVAQPDAAWRPVAQEARFDALLTPEQLPSRERGVLARDQRTAALEDVHTWVQRWQDLDRGEQDTVCELIATHNTRFSDDHPEFVRLRMAQWAQLPGVEAMVFKAKAGSAHGVLTAMIWRDWLDLYEIGLAGQGAARHSIYTSLLVHAPAKLARQRGLCRIWGGLDATTPKASRGAVLTRVGFGHIATAAGIL